MTFKPFRCKKFNERAQTLNFGFQAGYVRSSVLKKAREVKIVKEVKRAIACDVLPVAVAKFLFVAMRCKCKRHKKHIVSEHCPHPETCFFSLYVDNFIFGGTLI